jgi:hypothetical protein
MSAFAHPTKLTSSRAQRSPAASRRMAARGEARLHTDASAFVAPRLRRDSLHPTASACRAEAEGRRLVRDGAEEAPPQPEVTCVGHTIQTRQESRLSPVSSNRVGRMPVLNSQSRTERQTGDHSNGRTLKTQGNLQVAMLGMNSSVDALFVTTKVFGIIAFITIS